MYNSKVSVCLVQFVNAYTSNYGLNLYLPYSVGLLRAYSEHSPDINDHINFRPFIYKRNSAEAIAEEIGSVDVVGFSCYIWNWQLSLRVAELIRKQNPSSLIVVGGPQVSTQTDELFQKYPFLDIACHGEGELTFHDILRTLVSGSALDSISGTSFYNRSSITVITNPPRPEIKDPDIIQSPYLNGTFETLLEGEKDIEWVGSLETNRGCPYSCTFCKWVGNYSTNKVRLFSQERVEKEIVWFGKKRIKSVYGCDANFGILKRDKEIIKTLVRTKREYEYPKKFRVCFAKNSNENVLGIGRLLVSNDMAMGITISLQSLNNDTLRSIKRNNIKTDNFRVLQSKSNQNNIPTLTEMIVALPKETYNSFVKGLDTLLESGQHSGTNVYHCTILPNAEMSSPEYQQKYGIKTVEIPLFQPHSPRRNPNDNIVERETIVIATSTMSVEDWRKAFYFAWAMQCFHMLGMLQAVALFLRFHYSIRYQDFYQDLISYARQEPDSLVGREFKIFEQLLDNVLTGGGFDQYLPKFSVVSWRPEEASFLRLSEDIDQFYEETADATTKLLQHHDVIPETEVLNDLFQYQKAVLKRYNLKDDIFLMLNYNIDEYIRSCRFSKPVPLKRKKFCYLVIVQPAFVGDRERFSQEVVWYGRKGGGFFYQIRLVTDQEGSPKNTKISD